MYYINNKEYIELELLYNNLHDLNFKDISNNKKKLLKYKNKMIMENLTINYNLSYSIIYTILYLSEDERFKDYKFNKLLESKNIKVINI